MAVYSKFAVGAAQPSPIIPVPKYAPIYSNAGTNIGSWAFGGGVTPRPFLSYSQYLTNATNLLGPYCLAGGQSGRLIVSTIEPSLGEIGFVEQDWYDFNDGQYATDGNGNLYPSKSDWYSGCITIGIQVPNLMIDNGNGTRPNVFVQVAYNAIDPTSPEYFSSNNLKKWNIEKTGAWETSNVNYNLYNWLNKTYGLPAAEWYLNNPSKPHNSNPFIPPGQGQWVPLADADAVNEKSQNGQIAQLGPNEVNVMLQIIKHTDPSHYTYKHAVDTLDKWAAPGSSNRNKLIQIGVPLSGV